MSHELTKEEQIALVALKGLLASGHYTRPPTEKEDEEHPAVLRFDYGPDWKVDGFNRRVTVHAVSDAFLIAQDFLKEIEWRNGPTEKEK